MLHSKFCSISIIYEIQLFGVNIIITIKCTKQKLPHINLYVNSMDKFFLKLEIIMLCVIISFKLI